ncbi:hypothetical protein NLS1_21380 [Nocardioides sp. LS1]|nr:hypothetical protein NLS1_21380 [Nocardioides sp. LS1]
MSWETWTPLLRAQAETGGSVSNWVFVDLPGFGGSDPLPGPVTLQGVALAIREALHLQTYSDVTLVGHSMGGFLALDIAARNPSRGVVSFSGAYHSIVDIVNHPLRSVARSPAAWLSYSGLRTISSLGQLASPVMGAGSKSGLLRLALRDSLYAPLRMQQSLFDALARGVRPTSFRHAERTGVDYETVETWRRIAVPLLGGFGRHDKLVSAADRRALELAQPNATFVEFSRSGHFIPIEQPREALSALCDWGHLA